MQVLVKDCIGDEALNKEFQLSGDRTPLKTSYLMIFYDYYVQTFFLTIIRLVVFQQRLLSKK